MAPKLVTPGLTEEQSQEFSCGKGWAEARIPSTICIICCSLTAPGLSNHLDELWGGVRLDRVSSQTSKRESDSYTLYSMYFTLSQLNALVYVPIQ